MTRLMDETSEALIAAAHRLLEASGPEALTVRRIANEAGMSTMNVYSRFGGKDGVIDELFVNGYRRLIEAIQRVPHTHDVPEDLARVATTFRNWALEHPEFYGIMFSSTVPGYSPSPDSVELAHTALLHLVERIQEGQQNGDIAGPDHCDPIDIAAWLWATCHGMISFEIGGKGAEYVTWASIFENGVRTAIAGVHPSVVPVSVA